MRVLLTVILDYRIGVFGFTVVGLIISGLNYELTLSKDEYELIKTFEKGFDSNSKSLATWVKFLDNDGAYGALFDTPKRKKYPINRFQTYLAFEE